MNKIKILIVEDEPLIAKDLFYTLQDLNYDPVGTAKNTDEAISLIEEKVPDIVLLDINLEGEKDGFFVAGKLMNTYKIPFIFLSSHSDLNTLQKAKQYLPLGYLVKPIDENDLLACLEVALFNHTSNLAPKDRAVILPTFIFLKEGYTIYKVNVSDILYVEALDNYAQAITRTKKYTMAITLKTAEERLSKWNFLRVHRSFLINPSSIDKISENQLNINGNLIPISRRHKLKLLSQLEQL